MFPGTAILTDEYIAGGRIISRERTGCNSCTGQADVFSFIGNRRVIVQFRRAVEFNVIIKLGIEHKGGVRNHKVVLPGV